MSFFLSFLVVQKEEFEEEGEEEEEQEEDEVSFTPVSSPMLEGSLYEPSFVEEKSATPRKKLNEFLISRDISPIRHSLETPREEASERTKRLYTRKARQTVNACLDEIAPGEAEALLSSMVKSKLEENTIDSSLIECLAECYNNTDHWNPYKGWTMFQQPELKL